MTPQYWVQLATEQFGPASLVDQATAAERAGFDAVTLSDHFQPWWEPGESPQAWVVLGAIAQATSRVPLGTGVTAPVFRYNPAVVAQAFATLEALAPGRAFLGIGSGESLNETPCGMNWPPPDEQLDRMGEALEIITGLLDGDRMDVDGQWFRTVDALLHTLPDRRVPVYVSAFGPQAAGLAARYGDGLWTLAKPDQAPAIIEAYRAACDDLGQAPGEIILQTGFSWAPDDSTALESARVWKGAQPPEHFSGDWHDPAAMYRHGEDTISDQEFAAGFILASDPEVHVERIREVAKLGATVVCLQNTSGADPVAALDVYGERVLPALRAA
ncbi:TIGR03557 family F420-dependent LLM class oxidoreductase [Jiangella sp. DSM 45060]|uniref:TIGR03557 family F420-dependent LLM class oxidoreductase n=1 Tax=Jiangella sp. DSM 45060 TaxID=1798224 RepID=UPI00087C1B21|nr:TIGR03557 family F420-dependent LLM class oxidoreductase [Jiangella sp. DSM 45060]SDS78560.1 coenzyme F420-dependent glucose-6-phosphate dehydrogenase [Jiangella sp. DSM 45060]